MKKIIGTTGCSGLLALLILPSLTFTPAQAQGRFEDGPRQGGQRPSPRFGDEGLGEAGPRGGRRGGPGGFGGMRGAGMQGKRQLNRVWRGIERLEQSSTPLSKAQAQKVVALVLPWSNRPQMTNADAQKLEDGLSAILTSTQKDALRQGHREKGDKDGAGGRKGERRGGPDGQGQRGRGMGGPEGGGRRDGAGQGMNPEKMQQMRAFAQNFNPFYSPTGYPQWSNLPERMRQRMADRYKDDRATLEALSRKSKS